MHQGARHAVLILPGLYGSGDGHWQTIWEDEIPTARRVQQRDWNRPDRDEWVDNLSTAIRATEGPIILVAHSLGCVLAVWWAEEHQESPEASKVRGALLVAPPDIERPDFPDHAVGFAPMPRASLPFKSIVVASTDDPWCTLPRAKSWADGWGAGFHEIGARGHINANSGLANWAQGRRWLEELKKP